MKRYYILEGLGSKGNELPDGPRILIFSVFESYDFIDGDGPFNSIPELKKNSNRFKKLVRTNTKRAERILDKKYIIK